jgi:DNA polymerase III sliding clamp (beta) subunit (PCNA family)
MIITASLVGKKNLKLTIYGEIKMITISSFRKIKQLMKKPFNDKNSIVVIWHSRELNNVYVTLAGEKTIATIHYQIDAEQEYAGEAYSLHYYEFKQLVGHVNNGNVFQLKADNQNRITELTTEKSISFGQYQFSYPIDVFQRYSAKTVHFVSTDGTRAVLQSISINNKRYVSTDGRFTGWIVGDDMNVLPDFVSELNVPDAIVNIINRKLLTELNIGYSDIDVIFRGGMACTKQMIFNNDKSIVLEFGQYKYPEVLRAYDATRDMFELIVNRKELIAALDKAIPMSSQINNHGKFTFDETIQSMKLTVNHISGEMPITYDENFTEYIGFNLVNTRKEEGDIDNIERYIVFNLKKMKHVLENMTSDNIRIEFGLCRTSREPIHFYETTDKESWYLLMPLRS